MMEEPLSASRRSNADENNVTDMVQINLNPGQDTREQTTKRTHERYSNLNPAIHKTGILSRDHQRIESTMCLGVKPWCGSDANTTSHTTLRVAAVLAPSGLSRHGPSDEEALT